MLNNTVLIDVAKDYCTKISGLFVDLNREDRIAIKSLEEVGTYKIYVYDIYSNFDELLFKGTLKDCVNVLIGMYKALSILNRR